MHNTYLHKRKRFNIWRQNKQTRAVSTPLPLVLEYISGLNISGLFISLIKVHLMAITAFHHKVNKTSTFAHLIIKHFFKGIRNVYPKVHVPTQPWDLNLVLRCLIGAPSEPLATCSLTHLLMKVMFLVAITLACQVGEHTYLIPSFSRTRLP